MSVQYEKEGKAEGKGGHIVESRPGFLSVQSADKFLFVVLHTYHLSSSLLIPLFSKHVPARCSTSLLLLQMHIKHAILQTACIFPSLTLNRITPSHGCSLQF